MEVRKGKTDQPIDLIRNNDGTAKVNPDRYVFVDDNGQPVPELRKAPCCILRRGNSHLAVELADVLKMKRLLDEAAEALYQYERKAHEKVR